MQSIGYATRLRRNDDCLARSLDMLVETNTKKVTSTVMLNALIIEDIVLTRIHEEPFERILRLAGFTQDIYVVVRPSPYQRE